jgi:hypothetical protein
MNGLFKKIIPLLLVAPILLGIIFSGQSFAAQDSGIYTYVFHLYLDSGKLVKDRDYQSTFDLIAEQYTPPVSTGPAYGGQVISINGQTLATFQFYLGDIAKTGKGKLSVYAPYYADAKTVNFLDPKGDILLAVNVAPAGPVCNDNGICNADVGENYQNCPNDCPPSSPTPTPSIVVGPSLWQGIFLSNWYIWATVAIILILVVVWLLLKWLKKRKQNELPPPPQI